MDSKINSIKQTLILCLFIEDFFMLVCVCVESKVDFMDCHAVLQLLAMTGQVCHCKDDRTKQSSQNGLPRLPSESLAMTIKK